MLYIGHYDHWITYDIIISSYASSNFALLAQQVER